MNEKQKLINTNLIHRERHMARPPRNVSHTGLGALGTPPEVFGQLLTHNPRVALPLLAGLAVLAAAAIFSGWKIDFQVAVSIGLGIIGIGALLVLVSFVISNRTLKRVLGWFVTCFVMLVMTLMLVSAALPGQTRLPPIYCMVRPFEYCGAVAHGIAETLPGVVAPTVPPLNEATRVTSFRLQLQDPSYEEGGARFWNWQANGNYWEERYPSGKFDKFIEPGRLTLDDCSGTTVVRSTNRDMIFIPDKGCPTMIVRWRRGTSPWYGLGQMRDIT